jgi:hypothetical protein
MWRLMLSGVVLSSLAFWASPVAAQCTGKMEWITNPVDDSATTSLKFPTVDCEFYKLSWKTFLYVTHVDNSGDPRPTFLKFTTMAELFPQNAPPIMPVPGKPAIGRFVDRIIQSKSDGFVVDQSGRALYYGIHVNPCFVNFVKANGFDKDPKKIGTFDQFTPINAGALEIKSAWKIFDPAKDCKNSFFTIDTTIPGIKLVADPVHAGQQNATLDYSNPQCVTLALVGLHVAVTICDHREFIWATFEHNRNAPGLVKQGFDPKDPPVDAATGYTFYAQGTKRSLCNLNQWQSPAFNVATQKFANPTQVFRQFKFGHVDDAMSGINEPDDDVQSLNCDMQQKLIAANSIWQHYTLVGAVWIRDARIPGALPGTFVPNQDFESATQENPETNPNSILQGENRLSSSVIETFTQHDAPFPNQPGPALTNCFRCHNTATDTHHFPDGSQKQIAGKLINVSHVLKNAYFGIP